MNYRKFRLQNSKGQIYELTDKNIKVFGNNPSGLGFSKTIQELRIGNESLVTYSLLNLDMINLEILFYDDTRSEKYQKYMDFISFLTFKPIYLLYQRPNSFNWYRRRIESMSLSKTEVELDGMLHCAFQMKPLTFWEDDNVNIIEVFSSEETVSKTYPIEYPIMYGADSISNINIMSAGMIEAPLEITIRGTSTNPQYILYDKDGNIYGRGKFNGTFDYVYVNSKESEENIELIRNGLMLPNPLGYQDLTIGSANQIYVTFLHLKAGQSKLSFNLGSAFDGSVEIKWRNRYVSV